MSVLVFNVCIMMLRQRGMKTDAFICMSSLIYQGLLNKHCSKTGGLGQVNLYQQFLPFVISTANICPQKKMTSANTEHTDYQQPREEMMPSSQGRDGSRPEVVLITIINCHSGKEKKWNGGFTSVPLLSMPNISLLIAWYLAVCYLSLDL